MLSLELQADDHGLVECTCGHIGFVDEADPNTGDCVNCADEKARASMAEARAEARAEGGGLGITEVLKAMNPVIKDWHKPSNEGCAQNADPSQDCTCKLVINSNGKKRHKPRIIFRVTDHSVSGHKTKPQLVVEIHDDGKTLIREAKRRISYETTIGKIYTRLVWSHAMAKAAESKRKRAEKKRAKRLPRYSRKSRTRGKRGVLLPK